MKPQKSALRWVISNSKFLFLRMLTITLLSIILALFGVTMALVSKNVVDVATGQASGDIIKSVLTIVSFIALQLILNAVNSNLTIRASGRLMIKLRQNVFSHLIKKDWQSISAYHSGDLLTRINSDVNVIVTAVIGIVPSFLSLLTKILAGFGALFALDPMFSIVLVCFGPVVLILARIYSKKMKSLHKKCQAADGQTSAFMQESMLNMLMIKSFNSSDYIEEKSSFLQKVAYKLKIKRNTISIFANSGLQIAFYAGYYSALTWGALRLASGEITFGTMTAFLTLISQVQTPFMGMSGLLPQYYSMLASAERIMEIENLPDEQCVNGNLDIKNLYDGLESICAENITFSYGSDNIFDSASCEIKKGDFVAFAGTSGVGKSTLLKLILGIIHPSDGEIVFKTKSGNYIADTATRRLFSYVPQGNMILSGTLRDNIKFANKSASEDEVIRCAKLAEIWDFISSLPDGLDTVVGERGLGLSEGQVQRIAIARALLYDTPVLLLDEATSALDETTEEKIIRNLKGLESKTCLVISHRQAAIDACDKIFTVSLGKIFLVEK